MDFTLSVMGSASAMPVPERFQSAYVLSVHGRLSLIDCGEGAQRQLLRFHHSLLKVDGIYISHIHGDHLFGLFPLLSTCGMLGRTAPLTIFAPSGFGHILRVFLSYYGGSLGFEVSHVPLAMTGPQTILETKDMVVSAFPLNHGVETYGFRFDEKEPALNVRREAIPEYGLALTEITALKRGEEVVRDGGLRIPLEEVTYRPYAPRSFAYCSDTSPFPQLAGWVRGVDLLFHEATYLSSQDDLARKNHHSTTADAARCALEAGVGKLVIGHYSSRCKDALAYQDECRAIFAESYAADDGAVYDIPLRRP